MTTINEWQAFNYNLEQPDKATVERNLLHRRFNRIEVWLICAAGGALVGGLYGLWGLHDHLQEIAKACHLQ